MDITLALLKTSAGKDKIMRTVSYSSLLLTGVCRGKLAKDLAVFAKQISAARTVTRLFDDVKAWNTTSGYGMGYHERDVVTRIMSIISNLGFQLFYPAEHIGWAADRGFLSVVARPWQVTAVTLWLIALVANVIKCIRQLELLEVKRFQMVKTNAAEGYNSSCDSSMSGPAVDRRHAMTLLRARRRSELLSLLRNSADLVMAISFLPPSVGLWAGRLAPHTTAIFGTISSLIGLYTMIEDERRERNAQKIL